MGKKERMWWRMESGKSLIRSRLCLLVHTQLLLLLSSMTQKSSKVFVDSRFSGEIGGLQNTGLLLIIENFEGM